MSSTGAVLATSAELVVTWTSPTLTLSARPTAPHRNERVQLTAVSDQDVAAGPLRIEITDTVSRRVVARCERGTTCQASVVDRGRHTYAATVVLPGGRQVQAGPAPTVTVRWP